MDFQTYITAALRTAKSLPTLLDDLEHCALGLSTETGEVNTEIKRITIYEKPMTDEMSKHMIEELGDVCWYVPVGLRGIGLSELPALDIESLEPINDAVKTLKGCGIALSAMSGAASLCLLLGDLREEQRAMGQLFATIIYVVDRAAEHLGWTGEALRAANIEKLFLRFPVAYSNEEAEARADKLGLPATVS